jgi:hypothetical protein
MSEQGVPTDVLVGDDYMQVRAGLVELLGGGNEALVWTRVEFRTRHVAFAHQSGGRQWWEVTQAQVGREVGISVDAAKGALRRLAERGFLLAEQHSLPMQTMSYSPVILQSAESPIGLAPIGETTDSNRSRGLLQSAESPIALYIQEAEEVEEAPIVPAGPSADELFEAAWSHWPKRTEKKLSRERFLRALPKHPTLVNEIVMFGDAYSATTETQFVPALAVWINRERWTDDLPVARDPRRAAPLVKAASIVEMAARMQAEADRKAVSA